MNRSNTATMPSDYFNLDDDREHSPLHKSYSSVGTAASTGVVPGQSSSSAAVLAALRALQDKIRRLESERSAAIDESVQLRHQLKNLEIESEHVKQREILASQKTLQESRNAYDRLVNEKSDLEIRANKLEEKLHLSKITVDELMSKVKTFEEEKQTSSLKVKELEATLQKVEEEVQQAQAKEKDLAHTMIWETKRHEDEIENLKRKLRGIEEEGSNVRSEKDRHDTKLKEMEKVVNQLLSVNDALVTQITGKTESFKVKAKKISKAKALATAKPSKSPKSVEIVAKKSSKQAPVKTSSKVIKYDAQKIIAHANATADKGSLAAAKIDELRNLHKIYSKLTMGINDNINDNSGSEEDRPVPRKAAPKNISIDVKEASVKSQIKSSKPIVHHIPSAKPSSIQRKENFEYNERPTASLKYQSSIDASDDLKNVISSLEEEFNVLNKQYHRLLSTVNNDSSTSVETVQADELVNVIQKLHKKGEQLRHLKSPNKV